MKRQLEIQAERTEIETKNKSLRQRLNNQRQQLEDYLKEAERYADNMKKIEAEISTNNNKYFALGDELRKIQT